MNNIIPISRLAELLAARTGRDEKWCNHFVREYFGLAEASLSSGENVSIKGFGSFTLTSDSENPVAFTADPALAAAVNAPFEAFSPIKLGADETVESPAPQASAAPASDPDGKEPEAGSRPEAETEAPEIETAPAEPEAAPIAAPEPEPASEPAAEEVPAVKTPVTPVFEKDESIGLVEVPEVKKPVTPVFRRAESQSPDYYDDDDRRSGSGMRIFWFVIVFLIGLLLGCAIGFFAHNSITRFITGIDVENTQDDVVYPEPDTVPEVTAPAPAPAVTGTVIVSPSSEAQPTDSKPVAEKTATPEKPTKPAVKEPRYDTVTSTNYLTTMSRRYYNRMEYWVYIYDANPGLGNPNRIKPGTRVRVPEISELPLTGNSDADVKAAKKRSAEIYSRF